MRSLVAIGTHESLTLADVHRQHGPLLLRWTSRLAGPGADVEDALQEVLVNVHRALPGFRGDAKLTTFLYRITLRVVSRSRRRERMRTWLFGADEEVDPPAREGDPAELLERRQASARLYRALDQLSEKHRTAFLLFELEQLSAEEIAQVMETKPGTVWVWVHRARTKLKELLADE